MKHHHLLSNTYLHRSPETLTHIVATFRDNTHFDMDCTVGVKNFLGICIYIYLYFYFFEN